MEFLEFLRGWQLVPQPLDRPTQQTKGNPPWAELEVGSEGFPIGICTLIVAPSVEFSTVDKERQGSTLRARMLQGCGAASCLKGAKFEETPMLTNLNLQRHLNLILTLPFTESDLSWSCVC